MRNTQSGNSIIKIVDYERVPMYSCSPSKSDEEREAKKTFTPVKIGDETRRGDVVYQNCFESHQL